MTEASHFDSYYSNKYKTLQGETINLPRGQKFFIRQSLESNQVIVVSFRVGSYWLNGVSYVESFPIEPSRVADQIEESKRILILRHSDSKALNQELKDVRTKSF